MRQAVSERMGQMMQQAAAKATSSRMHPDHAHVPVLFQPVIDYLAPQSGKLYIDGTLGAGGHTKGILEASGPSGRVWDWTPTR